MHSVRWFHNLGIVEHPDSSTSHWAQKNGCAYNGFSSDCDSSSILLLLPHLHVLSNVDGLSGEESEIFDGDEGELSVPIVI